MIAKQVKFEVPETVGFDVPVYDDPHRFDVWIGDDTVWIDEYIGIQENVFNKTKYNRVKLDIERWEAIRGVLQYDFNWRLKQHGLNPAVWQRGYNQVDRLLGKELCLLAWAANNVSQIGTAVRIWLNLVPEDRWFLYNQMLECDMLKDWS